MFKEISAWVRSKLRSPKKFSGEVCGRCRKFGIRHYEKHVVFDNFKGLCCGNCDTQMFSAGYARFLRKEAMDWNHKSPEYRANCVSELAKLAYAEELAGLAPGWETLTQSR